MTRIADDLTASLTEAVAFARGQTGGARQHMVAVPEMRGLRRKLHMSQAAFAAAYRIPLATLKNWEQGRRLPDAPAAAYLQAIAQEPSVIRRALDAA